MLWIAVASLTVLWVAVACSARTTIAIGVVGPWSRGYVEMHRRAIQLAVEEINAAGGIRGKPLIAKFTDDSADGAVAVRVAAALVADPEVAAVVGHVNSGAMVAASGVYDGRMPVVTPAATSAQVTGLSRWVFRLTLSDSVIGARVAQFATARGWRRVSVLYESTAFGRGLAGAFRQVFRDTIVSFDPVSGDGTEDVVPHIEFLKARRVEAVFVAATATVSRQLMKAVATEQLQTVFLASNSWLVLASDSGLPSNIYIGAPRGAHPTATEGQRFVRAFQAKYNVTPDANAASAYDAVGVLARGLREVGTNRQRLRDYLAEMGPSSAYRGATGPVRFGVGGDMVDRAFVMMRMSQGTFTEVANK